MASRRLSADEEQEIVLGILRDRSLRSRDVANEARNELGARYPEEWVYLVAAEVLERLVKLGFVEKFKDPRWVREHCYRVKGKPAASAPPAIPKGCICPPGANLMCQRWDCGRKTITGLNGPSLSMVSTGTAAFESGLNPNRKD